jgi:streptogramin lyase
MTAAAEKTNETLAFKADVAKLLHMMVHSVSEHQVDKIARFDLRTGEWVEFPLPEAESDPRRIDIDPTNPNRIYFSGNTPGRVGFVEVSPE